MEDIRKGTCPLCKHNEIVEAPVAYGTGGHSGVEVFRLCAIPTVARGPFMIYVCRGCGHYQTYIANPDGIPIGHEHGTRLIKGPEPEGPYR